MFSFSFDNSKRNRKSKLSLWRAMIFPHNKLPPWFPFLSHSCLPASWKQIILYVWKNKCVASSPWTERVLPFLDKYIGTEAKADTWQGRWSLTPASSCSPNISARFRVGFCHRFLRWGQGTTTFLGWWSKPNNFFIASPSSVYTVTWDPTLFSRCLMQYHQPLYTCRDTHVRCGDNTVPNSPQSRPHMTFSHWSPSALLQSWSFFSTIKKEEIAALVGQILQSRQVLQDSKFRDVPLWMATASRSLKAGQQS